MWITGLFLVFGLMLITLGIVWELRSDEYTPIEILLIVCIGRYAFFGAIWIALIVLACIFQPVRTIIAYIEQIALVVWFIIWLKNISKRLKKRK